VGKKRKKERKKEKREQKIYPYHSKGLIKKENVRGEETITF